MRLFGFAKYVAGDCAPAQIHFERSEQLAVGPEVLAVDFFARFYHASCKYLVGKDTRDYIESLLYFGQGRNFLSTLSEQRSEYQAKLLANEGAIYLALGKLDEARQKTEEALSTSPGLIAASANLGIIFYRQGQYGAATEQLQKVLIQNPDLLQIRYFLVLSLYADNRLKDAKAELAGLLPSLKAVSRKVLESGSPREPQIDLAVLEMYFATEDVSKGAAFLRNYIDTNAHMTSVFSTMNPSAMSHHAHLTKEGQLHLASLYFEAGQTDDAQKIYELLARYPEPLIIHERLIEIYEMKRDQRSLLRALVRYGTAAYTIRYCGYQAIPKERRKYLESTTDAALKRALGLQSSDAEANFKLGLLAIRAGKNNRTPVFVDLERLLRAKGKERIRVLKEEADRGQLSAGAAKAVEAASNVPEVAAALDPIVDERASPKKHEIGAGTPILQPTDERRRTGSHYTPRSLTQPIVRHALEPAFERLGPNATPEQLLDLKVCDPAMGSGAFLVEACRAIAVSYFRRASSSSVARGSDLGAISPAITQPTSISALPICIIVMSANGRSVATPRLHGTSARRRADALRELCGPSPCRRPKLSGLRRTRIGTSRSA